MSATTALGIGVALSIVVAALLSLAETSLTKVSRIKVLHMVEEGRRGAVRLEHLLQDPPRFLNVILLLVLVVQLGGASLATLFVDKIVKDASWGWLVSTFGMTLLVFVLAEAAPKTFAIQHAETVALRLAPVVAAILRVPGVTGFTRLLVGVANVVTPGKGLKTGPFVTEGEIRAMAEVAAEEAEIEEDEKEMIHSIFEFGDTVVREVKVPRPDMVGVTVDEKLDDVLTHMLEHGFSRMPVFAADDHNEVVGLIYAKDVMRTLHRRRNGTPKPTLRQLCRKPMFVPESKKVAELLKEMQAKTMHMAIVVDEYGDIDGLVTMEDLLEEIVGEIADEYDREEPSVQPVDDHSFLVTGRFPIDELSELLDTDLPDEEWDTVGGLLAGLLGQVPQRGQEVDFQGVRFRADRVQGHRIAKVRVTKLPEATAQDA
ncbi:MAG TPA: hemolysin family protein [Actinomycetota bacterium]